MTKKKFSLVGVDGNAFCVLGYMQDCMEKTNYNEDEIDKVVKEATSGDYNHLLGVCAGQIEECNERWDEMKKTKKRSN